jgi:hypothetical protein
MWFLVISTTFSEILLILRIIEREMSKNVGYIGLHVQYPLFFNFLGGFSKNIKFHENPPRGSLVVPCGKTDGLTDRQLIVAFRNLGNALKTIFILWKETSDDKNQETSQVKCLRGRCRIMRQQNSDCMRNRSRNSTIAVKPRT